MDRLAPRAANPGPGAEALAGRAGLALASLLLALAGWVDGVGFVRWHELNTSFMSGNTTDLGVAPGVGDWRGAAVASRALLLFVLGVVLGEIVGPAAGRWRGPTVVSAEAALLWLAAGSALAGWGDGATASIAGLAMGVQTAAIHKADDVGVALTYVTGTLVNLGRAAAAALRGAGPWRATLPFAGFWLSLLAGAAAGAVAARAGVGPALVAAAGMASALALFAGLAARRSAAAQPRGAADGSPQATKAPLR